MKRFLFIIYFTALLILPGCYNASNDATVKINIGNIPVADQVYHESLIDRILNVFSVKAYAQTATGTIVKIHLFAYNDGTALADKIVDVQNSSSGVQVEFNVPAGDDIDILVIGENSSGAGEYFGFTKTDLKPGETTNLAITVFNLSGVQPDSSTWYSKVNLDFISGGSFNTVFWNKLDLPVKYHLYEVVWNPVTSQNEEVKLYDGYNNEVIDNDGGYHYLLYIEFEPQGLLSEVFDLNMG